MSSCLGLYIEENIIKYAKVTKDHETIKIDSFGVKFHEHLDEAIKQIIAETYSYKTPISVNLSEELYNYFSVFSLLNKNDIDKSIQTEFESLCMDKGYNKNVLDSRYALVTNNEDKDRLKVVHVAANKAEIAKIFQQLEGNKIGDIAALPMAVPNLLNINNKENVVIINIEQKTTVTTIIDNKINHVNVIKEGMGEILDKINLKENSYSKAYNVCKETTIYTSAGQELQEDTNEHLEDIMPTLYNIVGQVRKIINDDLNEIEKIYITGTGAIINNIDLYFAEYLENIKCEILRPYFIKSSQTKINMKDYIEVNSAISLALQGVGSGMTGMNFKKPNFSDRLPGWMKVELGAPKQVKNDKNKDKGNVKEKKLPKFNWKINLKNDLKEKFDAIEKNMTRVAGGLLAFLLIYLIISGVLSGQMKRKQQEVDTLTGDIQQQLAMATSDIDKINSKTSQYKSVIETLNKKNTELTEKYQNKDAIPNLLNQIMYIIPKNVQVTSIQNTSGKHIKITVQAEKYEQLGYFKAQLKNDQILRDVTSDQGVKESNIVKTTIEGELP